MITESLETCERVTGGALSVRRLLCHCVIGSSGAPPSTLVSSECSPVLTSAGVCPRVLQGPHIVQHNKSRHVPTRHQQPDLVYEPAPRPEGEEQRIREGGNPEKKTQHDSACFIRDGEQLVILVFFPAALCSAFQVLGGVLHILHNNSCHLEMCVDSWPTFTTAIGYRQKQQFSSSRSSSVAIPDICTIFTKNPATLRGLLLNERVINWRSGLIFRGIPSSHCHLIKELAFLSGLDITEYGGYNTFIHHTPENMDWQKNVLPLPIDILDESHAELVDAHLPYGGSQESRNHVRACIRHLPNHCVTDETGRPVAWMLSDELCELRMAYTLPEYRRAGHLLALSLALMRRMSSMGLPVYCHVHQLNRATVNAVTSLGFTACPNMENISVLLICKDRV